MSVDDFKKISKEVPLAKRPQKWWDLLSILGGIVGAILWFLYGGIRSGKEGLDLITPLLMIAIPIVLVWFRADIDQMLQPLQPTRRKISKILLIGLGIATPFLTAWILYNIFNISQYPLMQANIVVGTLAAYAITRDPQSGLLPKHAPGVANALILFTIVLCSCIIAPVMADDCARDPLNAQDCLRTNGYAEGMAGTAAAIISILVNGPIIMQTLIQGGSGAGASVRTAPPVIIPGGGGTATVTGGDGTDPVSKWIATRTTYPGSWILSPDGKSVKMEGLSGYEIPVEWITGTSENEIENIIFGTEIPSSDHEELANTITQEIDGTDLEAFTRSRWVEMGDEEKKDALTRLAQNLGKQLGESRVTVELDPNMIFGNGEPMDACFTNGTVKINPNSSLWNKPGEMIERLAHEVKHQQQGNPNNPMENEAARNAATVNDQNYHTFDSDPVKYSGQYVENDCNSFGQNVRSKLRGKAIAEQEEKLFNFLGELKDAAGKKSGAPKMTLDDIKKDPQGFLDHLEKNPDQKAKFVKILKRNKGM
ncbi:MAG: hypothetical protein CVV32_02020 [Methanomicrobiales archaeon HGW-Methanomicrobiales-3]|nr:MAG: hypothetical protein CVV32_02020 [Methanomicrobiales archaeon HGW-Methanomicrobiales-3]